MDDIIGVKSFKECDQQNFAQLSGDFNPLHIDPILARREIFGDVVVHGLHATVYALERFLHKWRERFSQTIFLEHISGKFLDPIFLNQKVEIKQQSSQNQQALLEIWQGSQICQEIKFQWRIASNQPTPPTSQPNFSTIPQDHSFDQLADHQDTLELGLDREQGASQFPHITKGISQNQFATLLALTRLVGMACPGLHSVFLGFDLAFHTDVLPSSIDYGVTRADRRFSSVQIAVKNEALSGKIDTRYRPKPIRQPSIDALQAHIAKGEFKSQNALIVGGSRGIGETTAKLIAAGGGRVAITYHQGAQDAKRVAAELTTHTEHGMVLQHTIGSSDAQSIDLDALEAPPTHLYYFASPQITPQRGTLYAPDLFTRFSHFYVDALYQLYQNYRHNWETEKLHIFFPSTIYLDEPQKGLTEYCAAKAAGETLCMHLDKADPNLTITIKRLPQVATDQTMGFMNKQFQDPHDILIPILRQISRIPETHSS